VVEIEARKKLTEINKDRHDKRKRDSAFILNPATPVHPV
jgi:hypothetical protein